MTARHADSVAPLSKKTEKQKLPASKTGGRYNVNCKGHCPSMRHCRISG